MKPKLRLPLTVPLIVAIVLSIITTEQALAQSKVVIAIQPTVASDEMLASVSRRDFKFTIAETEWSAVLTAQMAYCLLRPRHDGIYQGRFLTGFTFCDPFSPDVSDRIREFLRQIKTS